MASQFQVLASGSSGNASLLDAEGFGILIDVGVGPRQLTQRCPGTTSAWSRVKAVVLTHVHGDHWNENSLSHLAQRRIALHCHAEHARYLEGASEAFRQLRTDGLVNCYDVGTPWPLGPSCRCEAFEVKHDGGVTCGFRFNGRADGFAEPWSLAYAADLGCWTPDVAETLAGADVVALEFNHDVAIQFQSGRHPRLIRRVLGDHGHLSNAQAAELFAEVLRRSPPGRPRHLVQLHLSQQCNTPELAAAAANDVVLRTGAAVEVHTTWQTRPGPCLALGGAPPVSPRCRATRRAPRPAYQGPMLFPDWE